MAVSAFVDIDTLPQANSGTATLTEASFGTVDAGVMIFNRANTATQVGQTGAAVGVAFWDGTNDSSNAVSFEHGLGTTNTQRENSTTNVFYDHGGSLNYGVTSATDGVTITKTSGTTGVDRYVSGFFLAGLTNKASGTVDLGTGTSEVTVSGLGFDPNLVILMNVGDATLNNSATPAIFSLGFANKDGGGTISQGCIFLGSEHNVGTSSSYSRISNTAACGQVFQDALSWDGEVTTFGTGSFGITPSSSASNDKVYYLAIELPNADDSHIALIDAATSTGNDAHTGFGFQPEMIFAASENNTTIDTMHTELSFMFGMSDSTTTSCEYFRDEDAVDTTNTASSHSTNFIQLESDSGTTDAVATVSSFDSDGVTLNYSDAAAAADKILIFSVGDSAGTGTTINANTDTLVLTGQNANINAATDIDANTDTLVLTGQTANINAATNISANSDALVLTGNTSTVKLSVNVNANTDPLILTGQTATITTGDDTNINANTDNLVLTGQTATVQFATNISANTDTLTLTGQTATISEGFDGITIDGQQRVLITADYGDLKLYFNGESYFTL